MEEDITNCFQNGELKPVVNDLYILGATQDYDKLTETN